MHAFERSVSEIPDALWSDLASEARTQNGWGYDFEWWNNKYYLINPPNDGERPQTDLRGNVEIPYERQLFHPSPRSRFALANDPVAYFSSDFATNCCETIEQFSRNPALSINDLLLYLRAKTNPLHDRYGYPINVKIALSALILDIANGAISLLEALADHGPWSTRPEMCEAVLLAWEENARLATQAISHAAQAHGFHGIVYASARLPRDAMLPRWNLVMFSSSHIQRE